MKTHANCKDCFISVIGWHLEDATPTFPSPIYDLLSSIKYQQRHLHHVSPQVMCGSGEELLWMIGITNTKGWLNRRKVAGLKRKENRSKERRDASVCCGWCIHGFAERCCTSSIAPVCTSPHSLLYDISPGQLRRGKPVRSCEKASIGAFTFGSPGLFRAWIFF